LYAYKSQGVTTDMVETAITTARPNPAMKPLGKKGSDVLRWGKAVERDLVNYAKHLDEKAQMIYTGIIKSRDAGPVNKRVAARIIRRRLLIVAGCCRLASKHMGALRHDWVRMLGNPEGQESIKKTGFDLRA
jgi:hypothetical protein